jgi:hypothetical protein
MKSTDKKANRGNRPLYLTKAQCKDPYLYLEHFFDSACILSMVTDILDILLRAMCTEDDDLVLLKRSEMKVFYRNLGRLIKASYILTQRELKRKGKPDYNPINRFADLAEHEVICILSTEQEANPITILEGFFNGKELDDTRSMWLDIVDCAISFEENIDIHDIPSCSIIWYRDWMLELMDASFILLSQSKNNDNINTNL